MAHSFTRNFSFPQLVFFAFCLPFFFAPAHLYAQQYAAHMEVGNDCTLGHDTYNDFSFTITNYSGLVTANIDRFTIDLSTCILQDLYFDPLGAAGDKVLKSFTANSGASATGLKNNFHYNQDPASKGYNSLWVSFNTSNPADDMFGPFNTFSFSIDIDHSSLKNYDGLGNVGQVSGAMLAGATVVVRYADGTQFTTQLTPIPGCDGKVEATVTSDCNSPTAPSVSVISVPSTPALTLEPNHVVRVTGTPFDSVMLYVAEGALDLHDGGHSPSPYDIDPFEANVYVEFREILLNIGPSGMVDVGITLTNSRSDGGFNYIYAATRGDSSNIVKDGQERLCSGTVSAPAILHYYKGVCVNCGGSDYTTADGVIYQEDIFDSRNGYQNDDYTLYEGIEFTTEDQLFKTQLKGLMGFNVPVPNGDYEVICLFSENNYGAVLAPSPFNMGGVGSRLMDIKVEGVLVDNDLDIYSTIGGASKALIRRYVTTVFDSNLDLDLDPHVPAGEVPVISGYCIIPLAQSVFPVEFLQFTAAPVDKGVELKWTTAQEMNNDYFTVERSLDGTSFSALADIPGTGTSDSPVDYQSLDKRPHFGTNYYRIRQTDLDGAVSYSQTVAVFLHPTPQVSAYPNPNTGRNLKLHLQGYAPEELVHACLVDLLGKTHHIDKLQLDANGEMQTNWDLTALPTGIYLLNLQDNGGRTINTKIILK